jgi:CDGSH-type Zn-finger protein
VIDEGARIRVTEDGPYEVTGTPALMRTSQVETEYGEPVDWSEPEPLEAGKRYSLCRCGRSSTKPFCDDSHLDEERFDGTEVAARTTRASRASAFPGDGMTLTDDPSICAKAGYCRDRFTSVWELVEESSDPESRAQAQRMISLCPSGRLVEIATTGEDREPTFEPSIGVIRDGPIWVRGGIPVESADGFTYEVRNRVTLCRCGHSSNKPFCDGSHSAVGFRDG